MSRPHEQGNVDTPNKSSLIILGAGRPFYGEQHTALRNTLGQGRVLDWLLHAFEFLHPAVCFVGGYQVEEISRRYPDFHYTVNPEWDATGAAVSLLAAPFDTEAECFVSYVDIIFHESTVRQMIEADADIVVAVDTHWRRRFDGRTAEDLARCEKLNLYENTVTFLGADIDPECADAEFVGLVLFKPPVVAYVQKQSEQLQLRLKRAHLSELIEVLRARGFGVRAVDVAGDWAELNDVRDLTRFVLGTKAKTLQRLQGLVRMSRIEKQVSFTVGEWAAQSNELIEHIVAFITGRAVVRSSALTEDGFKSANAGAYISVLDVDISNADALRTAVRKVIDSYRDDNPSHQVLVQPMVQDVKVSGVVFTRTLSCGAPYYIINYDDSTTSTASITDGSSREHHTLLIHRGDTVSTAIVPESMRGLLPAVQEIEQLLGYDSLDIEFAICGEGQEVYILQVRPIAVDHTCWDVSDEDVDALLAIARSRFQALQQPSPFVAGQRAVFGIMPDWNPAEIIGTKPKRLSVELYRYLIMDDIWATQRAEYGYRDVRPQPLMTSFAGHPYVDIRACFNSFIPVELDDALAERLVDFYLSWLHEHQHLHDKVEFDVVPTCCDLNFERWKRRLRDSGRFSTEEISRLQEALRSITRVAFRLNARQTASIRRLEQRFDMIMRADMEPLERAIVLLEDCRRYGTLAFAHLARNAFVAVSLLRSGVETGVLTREAMDVFLNSIRTITHRFTDDAIATSAGLMEWGSFVAAYGHLRPGTYDVTSVRYADNPEQFLRPIVARAQGNTSKHLDTTSWDAASRRFSEAIQSAGLCDDGDEVEAFLRESIEGREHAKFAFTRNLSAALECLACFGKIYGLSREDVANLPLGIFFSIRTGSMPANDIGGRLAKIAHDGHYFHQLAGFVELPPLLFSLSDFDFFTYPINQPNFVGSGRISAECVELATICEQQWSTLDGKIVMIPQADPGYDWLFGLGISGLITMYGGANSHMAIRAAEFGLPAAIGTGEIVYQQLAQAAVLELDAENRRIRIIA